MKIRDTVLFSMELFTKNKKQRIIKAGGNKNPQSAVLLPAFYLSVIYFVRPAAFI